MFRLILVASVCLSSTAAFADDWSDGWCSGYTMAVKSTIHNRDGWRARLGEPAISYEDSRQRLFSSGGKPVDDPAIAPTTITGQTVRLIADSVDVWVLLPLLPDNIDIHVGDRVIKCPKPASEDDAPAP